MKTFVFDIMLNGRIICYELKCVLREGYCDWCSTARIVTPAKKNVGDYENV